MRLGTVLVIFRKEFLDVLRDRRTLLSMILLPLVIFPFLTAGLGSFMVGQIGKIEKRSSPIVLLGDDRAPELTSALQESPGLQLIASIEDSSLALEMLLDQTVQAVIYIPEGFTSSIEEADKNKSIEIWYDDSQPESNVGYNKVQRLLSAYRDSLVHRELENRGLPVSLIQPFVIEVKNRASQLKMTAAALGMILPYMVILLTMVGSTYSAIDLTAGEKERGTMETLLVSPATRLELVLGKFLTTTLAGLITAIIAVFSMSATFMIPGSIMSQEVGGEVQFTFDPMAYGIVLLLLIPVAALFAAVLIAVAINARSYKEAQSYVYPFILVVLLPAITSMLPGVETDSRMALIPVMNVSLALRDALMGTFDISTLVLTFVSSVLYAACAIFIAVRIFQKETVLMRT